MKNLGYWLRAHPQYAVSGAVALVGLVGLVFLLTRGHSVSVTHPFSPPAPKEAPSPLTGLTIPIDQAHRYPVAVIIESTPEARPQSGLDKAGLVYEAYAEGGITRTLAVFVDGETKAPVGPVRSVRTYFLDWASELDAILGHVGGNMDALDLIPSSNVHDLDEFANGNLYWRDQSRYAPHNVYTTLDRLRVGAAAKGVKLDKSNYPTLRYKIPAPVTNRPTAAELSVLYGSPYNVRWVYDHGSNRFIRWLDGAVQTDKETGAQIAASNVIIQTVNQAQTTTRIGEDGLRLDTVGSGSAKVYRDGVATLATWKKSPGEKTRFFGVDGKELPLNRGPTWIEIIPPWVTAG